MEQGEGLLDDVAEFAQAVDVGVAASGDDGQDAALAQFAAVRVAVVALSPSGASGRLRGWPTRPARVKLEARHGVGGIDPHKYSATLAVVNSHGHLV
ncbi:hypothetical protein ACIHFC_36910, partial [Streptomyces sp. NPDC052013]|uniref:hypothetical protein n=1 Tax=Streptomyces sp. NPDC052013 TaxID=3365679 RepID=UPI0037D33637